MGADGRMRGCVRKAFFINAMRWKKEVRSGGWLKQIRRGPWLLEGPSVGGMDMH